MNPQQARDLIKDTFTNAFDKARFQNFAHNLLNHIDTTKASAWHGPYIKGPITAALNTCECCEKKAME